MKKSVKPGSWNKAIAQRTSLAMSQGGPKPLVLALVLVGMLVYFISVLPINTPVAGLIGMTVVLLCCWYVGPRIALILPLYIGFVTHLADDSPGPIIPSAEELMGVVVMTALAGLTGLAGQFRRRLRAVTRRHRSRLREQSHALSLAHILFRDLNGRITSWSDGAAQLFGYTKQEAAGRCIQELLQTKFPKPLDEIKLDLLRDCQWQGEVKQRTKDGREIITATHWILYDFDEMLEGGVVEVYNDVTQLRLVEENLRESERKKDLFVATLAHELRNPLAPLRTGLDCLRLKRGGSGEDGPIFEIMGRQLEQLVRLIDDLLDVSRINTGKVELRRDKVILQDVVDDAVCGCRSQIEAARQELTVILPEQPVYLDADAGRLNQVLSNLLNNAIKFTGERGRIQVHAQCSDGCVHVHVQDSGIGISAQMLPRVFDMFAQVQDVRIRGQVGLGLGLNIVKSLVEMHGGKVDVFSDGPDLGTTFVVHLPYLNHVPMDGSAKIVNDYFVNDHNVENKASPRVLIVDDNQDAARTLDLALTMSGCTCRSVFDTVSGLQAAEQFAPEILILDLGMPGMSGLEMARHLRANSRFDSALLIAVTGWDKAEDVRESKAAGFDYHFAKPVDVRILQQLVYCRQLEPS